MFAALLLAAQIVPLYETPATALARDTERYAAAYGVPLADADRALAAEVASVPATDAIAREFADRLVGISIDRAPHPYVTVHLAGAAPVADRTIDAGGTPLTVRFHTGLPVTQAGLVAAIVAHGPAIRRDLRRPPAFGIDARTGQLVVQVSGVDAPDAAALAALSARLAAQAGVPVRAEHAGAAADASVAGGARVTGASPTGGGRGTCTAGFVVGTPGATALSTAAHCPDELTLVAPGLPETILPFVEQHGWGYRDVQVNSAPIPLSPHFYADTAKTRVRPVTDARARAATRVGDFVCHRGERTGYSCAEVLMTDFAPAGDLCGGACLPTWVAVAGPRCRGGDSGAPVFVGTQALGLVKGATYRGDGSCAAYYYMSLDYLPPHWPLLLTDPAAPFVG